MVTIYTTTNIRKRLMSTSKLEDVLQSSAIASYPLPYGAKLVIDTLAAYDKDVNLAATAIAQNYKLLPLDSYLYGDVAIITKTK